MGLHGTCHTHAHTHTCMHTHTQMCVKRLGRCFKAETVRSTQKVSFGPNQLPCCVTCQGQYLILPGDGDTARDKLSVEGGVRAVQVDAFHRGELLNVKDVLTINGLRLSPGTESQLRGGPARPEAAADARAPPRPPSWPDASNGCSGTLRAAGPARLLQRTPSCPQASWDPQPPSPCRAMATAEAGVERRLGALWKRRREGGAMGCGPPPCLQPSALPRSTCPLLPRICAPLVANLPPLRWTKPVPAAPAGTAPLRGQESGQQVGVSNLGHLWGGTVHAPSARASAQHCQSPGHGSESSCHRLPVTTESEMEAKGRPGRKR